MARHLLIIGGGAVGLCAAYYGTRMGHRVTLLERGSAGHDSCSLGNAGMIVPSHFLPLAAPGAVSLALKWMLDSESPFYIRPRADKNLWMWGWHFIRAANEGHVARSSPLLRDLHLASRELYEKFESEEGSGFGLVRNGLLLLCKTSHGLEEEARTAGMALRLGIPAEVLDLQELSRKDPAIRMNVAGGVYYPLDGHITPQLFMERLRSLAENSGAQFLWNTPVTGWRVSRPRIEAVRTPKGDFEADEFILAAGSWSGGLARELGLKVLMQAGKGYSLTLPRPPRLPGLCSILTEARIAVTPMGSSLRFAGTLEISGLNDSVCTSRVKGMIRAVPGYFPEFSASDFSGIHPWSGLRPCSPDGLPYLGRTARYSNLILATGHAMMGISLGPVSGRIVAQLASGTAPEINIRLLNPDRYS